MSIRWKAFFIAIPIAILLQCAIWLCTVLIFSGDVNYGILNIFGTATGLVSFFIVKQHLSRKLTDPNRKMS